MGYVCNIRCAAKAKAKRAATRVRSTPRSSSGQLRTTLEKLVRRLADDVLARLRRAPLKDSLDR